MVLPYDDISPVRNVPLKSSRSISKVVSCVNGSSLGLFPGKLCLRFYWIAYYPRQNASMPACRSNQVKAVWYFCDMKNFIMNHSKAAEGQIKSSFRNHKRLPCYLLIDFMLCYLILLMPSKFVT